MYGNVFESEQRKERALWFVIFLFGDDLSLSCFKMREMLACLWTDTKEPAEGEKSVYKPDYKIIIRPLELPKANRT